MYVTEPTCISVEAAPRPPCLPRPHPSFPSQATGQAQYAGVRRGRWRLQPVHMDMDARKEKEFDIACIPAPGHKHCRDLTHTYIHTTPAPQQYFGSLVIQTLVIPPRRTPSSFLTSLLGALQLCQTYMFQAAVVQLPLFPRAEALPPHKMNRVSIVPRSTDSKTQESLTHPIRVAFSTEDEYACDSLSQTDVLSVGKISAGQGPLPSHTRRMTARDQK
jgi:hypothetical protein